MYPKYHLITTRHIPASDGYPFKLKCIATSRRTICTGDRSDKFHALMIELIDMIKHRYYINSNVVENCLISVDICK